MFLRDTPGTVERALEVPQQGMHIPGRPSPAEVVLKALPLRIQEDSSREVLLEGENRMVRDRQSLAARRPGPPAPGD